MVGFRADEKTRAGIIKWAESQPDTPTLSEAIRRLVELGLGAPAKPKQAPAERAARAKELASKTIDKVAGAPDNDEKATRKARLIKGPEEFRELRADHVKAKGSPK
jgi:hypothetical protein